MTGLWRNSGLVSSANGNWETSRVQERKDRNDMACRSMCLSFCGRTKEWEEINTLREVKWRLFLSVSSTPSIAEQRGILQLPSRPIKFMGEHIFNWAIATGEHRQNRQSRLAVSSSPKAFIRAVYSGLLQMLATWTHCTLPYNSGKNSPTRNHVEERVRGLCPYIQCRWNDSSHQN